jgi:hypothetical protein
MELRVLVTERFDASVVVSPRGRENNFKEVEQDVERGGFKFQASLIIGELQNKV